MVKPASHANTVVHNEIEVRRRIVSRMMLQHYPQSEIADRLEVSTATISRDAHAVREQWRQRAAETYEQLRAEEMSKLDLLEREVWKAVIAGDKSTLWAVDRILGIMDRRARLMGLDRPVKVQAEVTHQYRDELDAKIKTLVLAERDNGVIDVAAVPALEPVDDEAITKAIEAESTRTNGTDPPGASET